MPVQDGLAAARQIRRMNRSDAAEVPIFAMTANAFSDDIAACREAGINEHFAKPLDIGKNSCRSRQIPEIKKRPGLSA